MERIHSLIDKLQQQYRQGAGAEQLLLTVQLLQAELVQSQQGRSALGTAKVAVTLPAQHRSQTHSTSPSPSKPEVQPAVQVMAATPVPERVEAPQAEPYVLRRPQLAEADYRPKETAVTSAASSHVLAHFEAPDEAPTLVQHAPKREVHEVVARPTESLNDRLKEEKTELVHKLKETPIRDLRKGVGINDRFRFISELFRGDEAMYERSIKTINNFNIFSEAEFWMRRELRLKLAWDDDSAVVQHFYDLVRRRFS